MADAGMKEAQPRSLVEVSATDLVGPGVVYCPNPKMPLWSNHPRVFIEVLTTGEGFCPYCSTVYRLRAGENIYIVKDGKIFTPELTTALDGITWRSVQALAADLGIPVEKTRLTRDDIYICDEAFFTGTAAEVTPIRELDGRVIGAGRRCPVTTKIQKLFFDVVAGKVAKHKDWLHAVSEKKTAKTKVRA